MAKIRRITDAERLIASLGPAPTAAEHAARVAKHKASVAPLIARLNDAGLKIRTLDDLLPCVDALQARILLRELPGIEDLSIRDILVRAMTQKDLRDVAFNPLVAEFRTVDDPLGFYKWSVGNAIGVMATVDDYEILVDLATDLAHGAGRQMLISVGLAKMRDPRIFKILKRMIQDDPQVAKHATSALKQVEARIKRYGAK